MPPGTAGYGRTELCAPCIESARPEGCHDDVPGRARARGTSPDLEAFDKAWRLRKIRRTGSSWVQSSTTIQRRSCSGESTYVVTCDCSPSIMTSSVDHAGRAASSIQPLL